MTGIGAAITGGRWNSPGTTVVYTAESLASAMLETLVHVDPLTAPANLVYFPVEFPDDVQQETLAVAELPVDWRDIPAPAVLSQRGDAWIVSGTSAVLCVPSAVVPGAHNYLLNPAHADAEYFKVGRPEPLVFDPRLTP